MSSAPILIYPLFEQDVLDSLRTVDLILALTKEFEVDIKPGRTGPLALGDTEPHRRVHGGEGWGVSPLRRAPHATALAIALGLTLLGLAVWPPCTSRV